MVKSDRALRSCTKGPAPSDPSSLEPRRGRSADGQKNWLPNPTQTLSPSLRPCPYPSPRRKLDSLPSPLPQHTPQPWPGIESPVPGPRPTAGPRPPGRAHLARGVGGSAARPPPPRQALPIPRRAKSGLSSALHRTRLPGPQLVPVLGRTLPPPLPPTAGGLALPPVPRPVRRADPAGDEAPAPPHPTANFPIGRETRPATRTDWMDVQRLQLAVGLLVLSVLADDRPPSGAGRGGPDTCPNAAVATETEGSELPPLGRLLRTFPDSRP